MRLHSIVLILLLLCLPRATADVGGRHGEPSGTAWTVLYPTSRSLDDLQPEFGNKVKAFIAVLEASGASVRVNATRRPIERAYLMHWAWRIARQGFSPMNVPPLKGVDIDWIHFNDSGRFDLKASVDAAGAMVNAYQMAHPAALASNHSLGLAIDMSIGWDGDLTMKLPEKDYMGNDILVEDRTITISSPPRNGTNPVLAGVALRFGVRKLAGDPPHWSANGR